MGLNVSSKLYTFSRRLCSDMRCLRSYVGFFLVRIYAVSAKF